MIRTSRLLRLLSPVFLLALPAQAQVVFSEYVEGSGHNRALEIYNFSQASVDLGKYRVGLYTDGSSTPSVQIALGPGVVASGDVWVLAHPMIDPGVLPQVDQYSSLLEFDGDDVLVLATATRMVDAVGEIGVDPGTAWGTGAVVTSDATLRRVSYHCITPYLGVGPYDPAGDWAGFASDELGHLGTAPSDLHLVSCTYAAATYRNPNFWGTVNPSAYSVASLPVLGSSFSASIVTTGQTGAYLVGFSGPRLQSTRWGNILVDYTDPSGELLGAIWKHGDPAVIQIDVPPHRVLAGYTICTQAVRFGGSVDLTNAQDLRFGF